MKKLSVVISAFNEEKNIKECLESIKWADEIILIDNTSTDKTVEIARKYTEKIYTRPNYPMLNINKNFGFERTSGDWTLNLDADERVTPELAKEINETVKQWDSETMGYWIPRKNIIFGKWIKSEMWWPDYQLRLFRKGQGRFPEKHIHEKLEVKGETGRLDHPLIHLNYSSVSQFLYKMEKIYTEDEVKHLLDSGQQLSWVDALKFPINDFLKTFFLQKGYQDGLHGLVLSLLQAFYMEVVFAKFWEAKGFFEAETKNFPKETTAEFRKKAKDFKYWLLETEEKETSNFFLKLFLKWRKRFF